MANFYLDIETEGFNIIEHKIITIQYQEIYSNGKPKGELVILKEWESSEEEIVKKFHKILLSENVWSFIPVMCNSIFDLTFLWAKFKKYNLPLRYTLSEYLYKFPLIDIKSSLIIANGLNFKGSGLDKMTNKETDGRNIPIFYKNKEFDKIEKYIIQETESFLECLQKIRIKLMEAFDKNEN